jgi:hypothetical protein
MQSLFHSPAHHPLQETKELGKTFLAFSCHDLKTSALDAGELSKIQKLENDLSVSLVAVDA